MIKHIVLFKFHISEEKETKMHEIKTQLEKLPGIIPELQKIHIGLNVNPAEKWDLSLEAEVENSAALNTYAAHPAHQAILQTLIKPLLQERACVDYIY